MTGDRRNDDAFDNIHDGAADDEEFILELDDVAEGVVAPWLAERLANDSDERDELLEVMGDDDFEVEPPIAAVGTASDAAWPGVPAGRSRAEESLLDDFEIELSAVDPAGPPLPSPGLLGEVSFGAGPTNFDDEVGFDDDDTSDFVLVDGAPQVGEDGELALDPADVLFEDARDEVAPTSAFGADLGPPFGHRRDFQMPDLEVEYGASRNVAPMADEEAFEVEVDFDEADDSMAGSDEEDHWQDTVADGRNDVREQVGSVPAFASDEPFHDAAPTDRASFGLRESTREISFDAEDEAAAENSFAEVGDDREWDQADADWTEDESRAQDDGDEALGEDEFDPIYGDAAYADDDLDAAASQSDGRDGNFADSHDVEPDYAEHEAAYADATVAATGAVVGAYGGGRRARWRLVAGLAAFVPIAAAGVLGFLYPEQLREWTSPSRNQPQRVALIDRVPIERPTVSVQVEFPTVAIANVPWTVAQGSPSDTPEGTPPVPLPPVAVMTPSPPELPNENVDPQPGDTVAMNPVVTPSTAPSTTPGTTSTPPRDEPSTPPVEVADWRGEFMAAGDLLIANDVGSTTVKAPAIARDLRAGLQAFARLHNGSFFTGMVTRVEESTISIAIETGVVTFPYSELQDLSPLASADMRHLIATERGFVRLQNRARLFGSILRNDDRSITLSEKDGVITVPAWQIDRVGLEAPGGIEILEDGEDEWLRARARGRLDQRASVPGR